jgi:hypothetical protein
MKKSLAKDFIFAIFTCALMVFPNILQANIFNYIYPKSLYPSFSNSGTIGLIQMPSARMLPSGSLAFSWSDSDPYQRGSIIAQPFEWLEASYQYTDINNALYSLTPSFSGDQTYKDKGFDIKVMLLKEGIFLPAVAFGMKDLAGTNVFSAEYLVASKKYNNLDFTFGLGWGTYSNGGLKNPLIYLDNSFSKRALSNDDTQGGELSDGNWFSGKEIGIFGGVEILLPNMKGTRIKIEYDSTDYAKEGFPFGSNSFNFAFKNVRKQSSKINAGLVFPSSENLHYKISYIKGNTISFGFSWKANLGKKNPFNKKKPKYKSVENKEIYRIVTAEDDLILYRAALQNLNPRDLLLQAAHVEGNTLKVVYQQNTHRSWMRATGRVMRVLHDISPSKITSFEVANINGGVGMHKISMNREDFFENAILNTPKLAVMNATIQSYDMDWNNYDYVPKVKMPDLFWSIAPAFRMQLGGPDGFLFGNLRLGFKAEFAITRNTSIKTNGSFGLVDNFGDLKLASDSVLPHVRTDIVRYLKESNDFSLDQFQLDHFFKIKTDIYGRFSVGLVESMFAAAGGEFLWKPFYKNYALGLEAWHAKQRDYDMRLKFLDYKTETGFVNFYYKEPKSRILFTIRGGRFLAGDSGFNFDFSRRFKSGFRLGAFFSLTDISKYEFGEGSFDKGFYFFLPLESFWTNYSKESGSFGLRPLTRDGAAQLKHTHPLYSITEQAEFNNIFRDEEDLYD